MSEKQEEVTSTGYETTPETTAETTPENQTPEVDDFGYEKSPKEPAKSDEKVPEPNKPEQEPKVEDPATGYGDDPEKEKEEAKPDEKKVEDKPKEEPEKQTEEVDLGDTEGLLESEVQAIKDLAKQARLSKDATKALVEFKKKEVQKYNAILKEREEKAKAQMLETRASWLKELKADPDFGGEAFNRNVNQVERLLKEFMPNTKKELTNAGAMLSPSVMRDLYNLSKSIYGSEKFTQGEAPATKVDNDKAESPLDFYNS